MKKSLLFLIQLLCLAAWVSAENAVIPGDVNALCYFDNFFYNLPEQDFFYYLNDTLLYTEPPDDAIYNGGMREKYLQLAQKHRQVKAFIAKHGNRQNATLSISLKDEKGFARAREFLDLLGLSLKKDKSASLQLRPLADDNPVRYYSYCRLKPTVLQEQLNASGVFFFKLQETDVPLPWDFNFLSSASGLQVDAESFLEQMAGNKRFSLLLAVLYRLSAREVAFVGRTQPGDAGSAWKRIFLDKRSLMGMLVLSNALRVKDGRLFLPGGEKARKFWADMTGSDPDRTPFDFIAKLHSLDQGKMGYLYVFSFFLPEANRRVLFFDYDAARVRRLYQKVALGENEKIKSDAFPRLEYFSYFSLLHALTIRDGRIAMPLGHLAWAQAMGLELPPQADECDFLESLLAKSAGGNHKNTLLHKFMSIYARFSERTELLTQEFLNKVFSEFNDNSTLIDFIDRIPLKKSESADALFAWQASLLKLNYKDQNLFSALAQALLEMVAHTAWFAPGGIDFDTLVQELASLPWQRPAFCDRLFAFIRQQSGVRPPAEVPDDSLWNFVLQGLPNQEVSVHGEAYEWRARDMALAGLREMMSSQEACSFAVLSQIHSLLDELAAAPEAFSSHSRRRLREAVEQLPYPDFSKDAPKNLRDRVIPYSKDDLERDLQKLLKLSESKTGGEERLNAVARFKSEYLLPNVKEYFLSLAYALNAKDPKLRIFMNPNLSRLHDFSPTGGSPWRNGSAPGSKTDFSGYYLRGGLSRLNLTFAVNWRSQLFEKNIFNSEQAQAMVYNIMAMLPQPKVRHSGILDALLVELAVEMLQKCRGDSPMLAAAEDAAMTLTAGYHYRQLIDFLSGQAADYYLFFSELRQIGANFSENPAMLDGFSHRQSLAPYLQMPLSSVIAGESSRWGNIFCNSSGSLNPRANALFPQETAQLFAAGWLSGEALAEYKIKTAYLAYKNDFPTCLAGQFVFDFISSVGRSVYAQNHVKDYHSTHFVLDIMNSAHLKNTLKKLQKSGFLRLR